MDRLDVEALRQCEGAGEQQAGSTEFVRAWFAINQRQDFLL